MFKRGMIVAALAAGLAGCQTLDRESFSRADLDAASPPVRFESGDREDSDRFVLALDSAARAAADGSFDILALSSGGANGAYGAGVLIGWSERGDRPVFEVVTGVSIGALMAPFAFVGRERDADLRAILTDGRTNHLLQARWGMALVSPGLYRTAPLRDLITAAVDEHLLAQIAEAHRAGRRLYVATTSLDTQEQVIWDMGALAASNDVRARDHFINILIAAASVPGAFEPVLIELENDGRHVHELHADGRSTANFFVAPESVLQADHPLRTAESPPLPGRIWVIINGSPSQTFTDATPYTGVRVLARTLESMLNASTRLSLIATGQFARLNDMDFAVATAGAMGENSPFDFDRKRMNLMFEQGRQDAVADKVWKDLSGSQGPAVR